MEWGVSFACVRPVVNYADVGFPTSKNPWKGMWSKLWGISECGGVIARWKAYVESAPPEEIWLMI